ncbi:hypothetical protein [Nodosilinea nodulosa]|uniref:hypothetical protein n=1 Tax=Nodosilinea nodulosa TaxID=416001 RepID=UPI0002DE1D22|nr:hypothetical protein [Nodosilinea nodulosa]
MKRKSKPLITGGLLGLAGLGLLPRSAQASADLPPVVPDPSLGTALAKDPHPVVVPEPSAQTTEPQTDDRGAAQPAWTPETDQAVVTAAATAAAKPAAAVPQPALAEPEVIAPKVAIPDVAAPDVAVPDVAASDRSALASDETDRASPGHGGSAIAAPAPSPAATPDLEPAAEPTTTALADDLGERSPATAPAPRPDVALAAPGLTLAEPALPAAAGTAAPADAAAAIASPAAAPLPPPTAPSGAAAAPAHAPSSAPTPAPVATRSAPSEAVPSAQPLPTSARQTAPDLATLRSRAATVQALLQDLRSAYGIEDSLAASDSTAAPASLAGQVSQPETLHREPQLPPLPSRSVRRSSAAPSQKPVAAAIAPPAANPSLSERPRPAAQSPQLPALPEKSPNVALALPTPQPVMSSGRAAVPPSAASSAEPRAEDLFAVPALAEGTAQEIGQETASDQSPNPDAGQLRNDLRIEPLTTAAAPAQTFPPSPNAGIPSAFGANGGDLFFSASLAGADRLRAEADGSLSMGFGLGDSRHTVGVELTYNLQSIRRFGQNGGFDVKVHREVYSNDDTQVAAAVGLNNFAAYGSNAAGTASSLYGIVTVAHLLQPEHPSNRLPITASLGLGGGNFSGDNHDVGVIAGVGLQVHPQFSINTAWSGVGVNVGASIVPVATIPLTLNLLYGDVGNNTRAGSVAVLSVGYGFNFGPRF